MTQEEILELYKQSHEEYGWGANYFDFIKFAKLVAEKEREACAKLVDYWEAREGEHADAIRARGQA